MNVVVRRARGGGWAVGLASVVGAAAVLYPFVSTSAGARLESEAGAARAPLAPLLLAALTGLALLAAVGELGRLQGTVRGGGASKVVALLGALVAIDATLRLAPTFLGASPIFALIILVGFVFGSSFGFLMGSLTLLLSAFLTGGLGPWLPFQMLGAGWVGLGAGWLGRGPAGTRSIAGLALYGALVGFLYGALLNLYTWPLTAPGVREEIGLFWTPGLSLGATVERYAAFYLATSLLHDAARAVANAVILVFLGRPVVNLLGRYAQRFDWQSIERP